MKFKILIASLILLILQATILSFPASSFVLISFVHDGDTVVLTTGEQIRYGGVDAPEMGRKGLKGDFMALESRNYNLYLVQNAWVRLEFDKEQKDRHGRTLAYVFLEKGEMVNRLLVRKGLAFVFAKKPNMKYFTLLLDAQRQAMKEKIGIWSKALEKPELYYLGNRQSYRFHRPDCPLGKKISSANVTRFDTWQKAYWEGFSPCRQCKP
ncbi:MAG: thermonuclease family protein [Deltaproteobacteria bacterium]|nr:thermonuclease family protein [Deltaproteobacteria bacterium]